MMMFPLGLDTVLKIIYDMYDSFIFKTVIAGFGCAQLQHESF